MVAPPLHHLHASLPVARAVADTFTAEVWRAKMMVLARGENPTAGKVARQLVNDGLIDAAKENAQRNSRVGTALTRVHPSCFNAPLGSVSPP